MDPSSFPNAQKFNWIKLFKRIAALTPTKTMSLSSQEDVDADYAAQSTRRRRLAATSEDAWSGIQLKRNMSMVDFGVNSDASIRRIGVGALELDADLSITGELLAVQDAKNNSVTPVSYTHLTLPTIYSV